MAKRGIVVRTVAFDKGIVITASKGGDEIYGSTTAWLAALLWFDALVYPYWFFVAGYRGVAGFGRGGAGFGRGGAMVGSIRVAKLGSEGGGRG